MSKYNPNRSLNLAKLLLAGMAFAFSALMLNAQSEIRGKISDEEGEPIYGARVIIPELGKGALSNGDGLYSIPKLKEGQYKVIVTYIGMDSVVKTIEVKGKTTTENFLMRYSTMDVVEITDTKLGKIDKKRVNSGITKVSSKQINMLPSLGTPDLAQYLQVLPGVINTGDQGGQVYIRGGTPIQNMVLMDGAIIYSPFHSMGSFSVFDTDAIRDVEVYSAAFPGQYGGRVSSIMDIRTKNGNFKELAGKVSINPINTALLLEGPLIKKKDDSPGGSSFLLSARHSYLNQTSNIVYPYVNEEVCGLDSVCFTDTTGLPFSFTDIYAKTTFSDGGNFINLFGFSHNDNVTYGFPADYKWNSWGGGSNFMLLPGSSSIFITGNFAYSKFTSQLLNQDDNLPRESSIGGFNGKFSINYILNSVDEISVGLTALGFTTDYRFSNSFGLTTEQQFNNSELAFDFRYKKVIQKFKGGIQVPDSAVDLMVIEPSIRAHYYNDHSRVMLEPRLRTKFNFNRVSFNLAGGIYSQNLMAATSDREVVNLFTGFLAAPPNLEDPIKKHALQTAVHGLAGLEIELFKGMETTVEGWVKDFTQLTNINREKLFEEDPDFIVETGLAYGLDFIVRYETPKLYLYGTYGLAKAQRDNFSQVYPTLWDRRHNVNVVAAYKTGKLYDDEQKISGKLKFTEPKWEFSLRWSLGSGFPFTQTLGFFEKLDFTDEGAQTDYVTQNGDIGVLYADQINGGRLPYFHRLDLAAKRRWAIKNKVLIEAALTTLNTYNRANVFYFDRIRNAVIDQLPILPSFGLSAKF